MIFVNYSMKEIYKIIEGFDKYEVSNFGNVKSKWFNKTKIIKQSTTKKGYKIVSLYNSNSSKKITVHQLVSIAFLNHKPNGNKLVINHIDENKTNNHIDNLEIISNSDNLRYSRDKSKTTSKYFGVYLNKKLMKYHAQIYINSKNIHLGYFKTEDEANDFYNLAYDNIEAYDGNNKEFRNYLKNKKI